MNLSRDFSQELSNLHGLSVEQQQRLTELLDQYLRGLESGQPLDPAQMMLAHPDLSEALQCYLIHLETLHEIAAGFQQSLPEDDAASAPTADGTERRLGDFVLEREIGRGGMGVVYEARQISLDRRVAVKVLPFAAVLDSKQIARFKNEAQAAAQVQHPHIVPVFAIGVERGVHYYAMQYVDGQPLDRMIAERRGAVDVTLPFPNGDGRAAAETRALAADPTAGPLATARGTSFVTQSCRTRQDYFRVVARMGMQAAEALHAAHEYGVVHRDVKPSNLLVDHAGKLWVTDFGLARCQADVTLTRSGDLIGTLRYMSPEQAAGHSAFVDNRSDVYSLGATLYELLTLHPAFPGDHQMLLLQSIAAEEPVPPSRHCADLPSDLETIVVKAMAKSRDDRYATAAELAADLQRFLDGQPIVARPPSWLDRASRWARYHRNLVASGMLVGLVTVVALACSTLLIARAQWKAEANRQRAEHNLREARRAVEHFGMELPAALANVAGADQIHRQFLLDALDYYQRFAAQDAQDPTLLAEIALSHSRIGTLQERIGSREEALAAHRTALELYRQLQHQFPHQLEYQRDLALCHNNLGQLLSEQGELTTARLQFEEALAWQEELKSGSFQPERCRADLAKTKNNLGLLLDRQGESTAAAQMLEEAIREQRQVVTPATADVEAWRQLGTFCTNLSGILTERNPTAAARWSQAALEAFQEVVARDPQDVAGRYHQALAQTRLAAIQARSDRQREAETNYQRARSTLQQLQRDDPANRLYRTDLALVLNGLGSYYSSQANWAAAVPILTEARDWQAALAVDYPEDASTQSGLGAVCNNLGFALQGAGQYDLAVQELERAVVAQQLAWDARPDLERLRAYLSNHLYNYGEALRKVGRAREAAEVALRRRELWASQPTRLLAVAEELALAVADLQKQPVAQDLPAHYQVEVLETLRLAAQAGLRLSSVSELPTILRGLPGVTEIPLLWSPSSSSQLPSPLSP